MVQGEFEDGSKWSHVEKNDINVGISDISVFAKKNEKQRNMFSLLRQRMKRNWRRKWRKKKNWRKKVDKSFF